MSQASHTIDFRQQLCTASFEALQAKISVYNAKHRRKKKRWMPVYRAIWRVDRCARFIFLAQHLILHLSRRSRWTLVRAARILPLLDCRSMLPGKRFYSATAWRHFILCIRVSSRQIFLISISFFWNQNSLFICENRLIFQICLQTHFLLNPVTVLFFTKVKVRVSRLR